MDLTVVYNDPTVLYPDPWGVTLACDNPLAGMTVPRCCSNVSSFPSSPGGITLTCNTPGRV